VSRADRTLAAAAAVALLLASLGGWLLLAPSEATDAASLLAGSPVALGTALGTEPPEHAGTPAEIVVDVEGGVQRPGIQRLPTGARVADAIAAAGGYGESADLLAAAASLNLAKPLSDGEQVFVPVLGATAASTFAATGGGGNGSLVNLNTATPEELEALPGIGSVTVQKIVAARQERPFASLEDAVERGVLNRGQLEQIRELATAS
jgi:competence protein ComEA